MSGGEFNNIAHVVAVNMGYGHERPGHVLRTFATGGKVIVANDYDGIPESDRAIWQTGQVWYERISRFKKIPLVGSAVFGVMDELQRIPPFYPRRDLSAPTLQLRQLYYLIREKGLMRDLMERLSIDPKPLVGTYMSVAFAAEEYGYPEEIFTLVTDADMSRAWCPMNPKRTRIRYFAPTGRVAERLQLYGVPEKNIELTGFPLPTNLIGGEDAPLTLKALERRICNLDPQGIFVGHTGQALTAHLGPQYCESIKRSKAKTITIAFAVGGAGAQKEIGVTIAKSLRAHIRSGAVRLHLIAGTRPEVAEYFRTSLKNMGLGTMLKEGKVNVLFEANRPAYFDAFTALMGETDILWTKPSELSFYTGLGIPIIMAPTVGSQEQFNRQWLTQIGGGMDQQDPRYANEWLMDWVRSGALARAAWNGYMEAPTHGAYRIADILLGRPNTIHELPLVV